MFTRNVCSAVEIWNKLDVSLLEQESWESRESCTNSTHHQPTRILFLKRHIADTKYFGEKVPKSEVNGLLRDASAAPKFEFRTRENGSL